MFFWLKNIQNINKKMIRNDYSISLNFYSAVIWVSLRDFWPIRILNEKTLSSLPLIINKHWNNSSSTSKDNLLVKEFWTLSVYRNPKQYYIKKKTHKAKTFLGQAHINRTTIWSHARNYVYSEQSQTFAVEWDNKTSPSFRKSNWTLLKGKLRGA